MSKPEVEPAAFHDALAAVDRVLTPAGLTWWIQDGTLLGAVRGGGPVPGDTDIDIGMPASAFRWSLVDDFRAAGFAFIKSRGTVDDGLSVRLRFAGVAVDLFLVYERDGRWFYTCDYRRLRVESSFAPFGLARIDFLGLDVPCPDPAEPYLEATYGKDWRIPVREWHYAFSPYNVTLIGGSLARIRHRLRHIHWRARIASRRAWRSRAGRRALDPGRI